MKLEPYPQDVFPEEFVQWARPSRPLKSFEMYRAFLKQLVRRPTILLFQHDDLKEKRGESLSNDFSQTIPHTHSWAGYLHFHSDSEYSPIHGSSIPTVFCQPEDVSVALRYAVEKVRTSLEDICTSIFVDVTDAGWPGSWLAKPLEHLDQALIDLDAPIAATVHQAMARIRKAISGLPLPDSLFDPILTTFIHEAQSSIESRSLPIDVSDGKTIVFPARIGHFRQFKKRSSRPNDENPIGGKIYYKEGEPLKWGPTDKYRNKT